MSMYKKCLNCGYRAFVQADDDKVCRVCEQAEVVDMPDDEAIIPDAVPTPEVTPV